MDMRAEHHWASFKLNNRTWTTLTHKYNDALEKLNKERGILTTVRKNPLALVNELAKTENHITNRVVKNDFRCTYLIYFTQRHLVLIMIQHEAPVLNTSGVSIASLLISVKTFPPTSMATRERRYVQWGHF